MLVNICDSDPRLNRVSVRWRNTISNKSLLFYHTDRKSFSQLRQLSKEITILAMKFTYKWTNIFSCVGDFETVSYLLNLYVVVDGTIAGVWCCWGPLLSHGGRGLQQLTPLGEL